LRGSISCMAMRELADCGDVAGHLSAVARVAPTFGRLCCAITCCCARPNVGAAQPCEAISMDLLRERTDNRPFRSHGNDKRHAAEVGGAHSPG
jgi:hypothetical protein